jgi:hypothetical protein
MDSQIQLTGLDQFLSTIYGSGTSLKTLLAMLGFNAAQVNALRERHLPALADGFIEVVRKRLTWEDKDLWFRILARRFGLDGEAPASLEAAAQALNVDPPYAAYAEGEALQKCRTKTALQDFKKELHRLALDELSRGEEKPGKEQIVQKLDRLTNLRAAVDVARMDHETKRTEVLKKVQAELDAIEAEFQPVLDAAEANASALEAEIKNDVLLRGESLHGGVYHAIYMKGRVSWDSDGINDYARAHPEVLKFRKEGQPSVSLRAAADRLHK